jgi:class 3 adenylate cyclase
MPEVRQWLGSLGLARYADAFDENAIGWEVLPELDHDVLKDVGVRAAGDRVRILKAVAALKAGNEPTGPTPLGLATDRPPAGGEAERRQLTVMFADLVDSTALSQKLDPEEFREINRAYQLAATAAIVKYGGYVAKYMGDGVLAYFGYPQAHEDDAERAV